MKSIIKLMCISTLFLGSATELHAEEPMQEKECQEQMQEAKARQEAAEKRIEEAKQSR